MTLREIRTIVYLWLWERCGIVEPEDSVACGLCTIQGSWFEGHLFNAGLFYEKLYRFIVSCLVLLLGCLALI
jgi:hypothetical protein